LLFIPATSTHLLAKATERGADALVVDLEDAIPPDRKAEARAILNKSRAARQLEPAA
jgi:citrate lyase subunit beta/citryl-CoA lyase